MKKGAAVYYASDKNIFDALNQSKVDSDTIQAMFRRRKIVCSRHTKREELARFFSRLTHDLLDHHDLSDRLGVVPRRERITAVDLVGEPVPKETLQRAVDAVKSQLGNVGDVVKVSNTGSGVSLSVTYSVMDYKRSEFSQLQNRRGIIEIIPDEGKLVVRSTKADYLDIVRDDLIRKIQDEVHRPLERREISLFHHPDPQTRSQFFYDLMSNLIFETSLQDETLVEALLDARDIFYLSKDEIFAFIEGRTLNQNLKALVALRQAEFAAYRDMPAPSERFASYGPVYHANDFFSTDKTLMPDGDLKGIGCCPGRVRARARVVLQPEGTSSLEGDILVTSSTDPGWVTLFPSASGIIVERGSLLSHSAIVSREMGKPCIVSVSGLLKTIQTGDEIEMDGSTGEIKIINKVR